MNRGNSILLGGWGEGNISVFCEVMYKAECFQCNAFVCACGRLGSWCKSRAPSFTVSTCSHWPALSHSSKNPPPPQRPSFASSLLPSVTTPMCACAGMCVCVFWLASALTYFCCCRLTHIHTYIKAHSFFSCLPHTLLKLVGLEVCFWDEGESLPCKQFNKGNPRLLEQECFTVQFCTSSPFWCCIFCELYESVFLFISIFKRNFWGKKKGKMCNDC